MHLKDLWDRLLSRATADEREAAEYFREHIEDLGEQLSSHLPFQEFPKWVGGRVVNNAVEEAAMKENTIDAALPQIEPTSPEAGHEGGAQ